MKTFLVDADGMDGLADRSTMGVLFVTRREIERGNIADCLDRLHNLTDGKFAKRSGFMALAVDGYDADPRDLSQIPEVIGFFGQIFEQWNFWFHYMIPVVESGFPAIIRMQFEIARAKHPELGDLDVLDGVMNDGWRSMNLLHRSLGIGLEENKRISKGVIDLLPKIFSVA